MPTHYLPVLIFIAMATAFGLVSLVASRLLHPRRPTPVKLSPYESGIPPLADARGRYHVRYYLIAVLFVLFDIETVFLLPGGLVYRGLGVFGFAEILIFILILLVGFIYAWKQGALDWD
ncbi:MAG: NADH-quinone oxidoreductase subunit A [Nitrospirae bacterium]|nr:NADH-quinone oxidoreductase subunit A [Nitrospirota bacterium]